MDYDARAKLWRTQKCPPPHTTEKKQRQENPITAAGHTLPGTPNPPPKSESESKKSLPQRTRMLGKGTGLENGGGVTVVSARVR